MMMSFAVPSAVIGTGYYLDHYHGAIAPTATRANALIAIGALGLMAKDVFEAKTPEDRKKRLRDDALRIGLPTVATLIATQLWMKPEGTVYNTTPQAIEYFKKNYEATLIPTAQAQAKTVVEAYPKFIRPIIWGELGATKTVTGNLEDQLKNANDATHPLLDIQVAKLISVTQKAHEAFAKTATEKDIFDRFSTLQQAAEESILERAKQAEIPEEHRTSVETFNQLLETLEAEKNPSSQQIQWLESLTETIGQLDWIDRLKKDKGRSFEAGGSLKQGISKASALNKLFHHELRLLLPTAEDLGELKGNVLQTTAKEFVSEAAVPFMLVGGASVLAGVAGGLIANKLNTAPPEKNMDVVKEGIFQYVANIVMCGIGAGVGLLVANLAGFTKQEKPLLRFATIVAGLAGGIAAGAAIANPLCNKIEQWLPANKQNQSSKGRKLEWQDAILHVDDVPTAFSVAGVQALKPLLPMFFIPSGLKAAMGYRNEEPLAHLSPFDECVLEPEGTCP